MSGARSAGLPIVSDRDANARSGIVVIGLGGRTITELAERARKADVQMTIRDTGVRVAPHGYNTEDDIDRVLGVLA